MKDDIITQFSSKDQNLIRAISEASEVHKQHLNEFGKEYMMMDESDLITHLQSDMLIFMPQLLLIHMSRLLHVDHG